MAGIGWKKREKYCVDVRDELPHDPHEARWDLKVVDQVSWCFVGESKLEAWFVYAHGLVKRCR